jgi:hypothetical protein
MAQRWISGAVEVEARVVTGVGRWSARPRDAAGDARSGHGRGRAGGGAWSRGRHLLVINNPPRGGPPHLQADAGTANGVLSHPRPRFDRPGSDEADKDTSGLMVGALAGRAAAMQRDAAAGRLRRVSGGGHGHAGSPSGRSRWRSPRSQDRRRVVPSPDAPGEHAMRCCPRRRAALSSAATRDRAHESASTCRPRCDRHDRVRNGRRSHRPPALHAWRVTMPHPVTRVEPSDGAAAGGDRVVGRPAQRPGLCLGARPPGERKCGPSRGSPMARGGCDRARR